MIKLINRKPTKKQIIWFAIVSVLYILWVIWLRSYWMFIGLAIIFDIYISKKVKWNIFKPKEGQKKKKWVEWVDALVFALVVSSLIKIFIFQLYAIPTGSLEKTLLIGDRLFVSKVSYGPQMPMTPIAFPLVHNTIFGVNSYIEWPHWDYKRLAGLGSVKRDDIVVFNFPVGDTIIVGLENPDYYEWVREQGWENIHNNPQYVLKTRPLDKKENFVKRCVGLPGDTLTIVDTKVYRNNIPQKDYKGIQFNYIVRTNGEPINPKALDRLEINKADKQDIAGTSMYQISLTNEKVENLKQFPMIVSVEKIIGKKAEADPRIFPHDTTFKWNNDNFGPLWIPKKGVTIKLTRENIILYRRVIDVYENNEYQEKDGKVFIDGKPVENYTFKQNYYWMMGDNRHNSADSRAWGFVPEDHIVGKPVMIFYSLNQDKSFPSNIRWDRLFKIVREEE